uniref:Secreted protein n=2 Tax=Plectus sambesii TaxID=2011161 RepID=A0A914X825_9BILA
MKSLTFLLCVVAVALSVAAAEVTTAAPEVPAPEVKEVPAPGTHWKDNDNKKKNYKHYDSNDSSNDSGPHKGHHKGGKHRGNKHSSSGKDSSSSEEPQRHNHGFNYFGNRNELQCSVDVGYRVSRNDIRYCRNTATGDVQSCQGCCVASFRHDKRDHDKKDEVIGFIAVHPTKDLKQCVCCFPKRWNHGPHHDHHDGPHHD